MIAVRFWALRNWGDSTEKAAPSTMRKASTPLTRSLSASRPKPRCGGSAEATTRSADMRGFRCVPSGGHHYGLLVHGGGIQLGHQLAFGDDQDAVADGEQLGKV